jgi:prolyl oligopeptidase
MARLSSTLLMLALCVSSSFAEDDPYLWLEDVQNEDALSWAREQNNRTFDALRDSDIYRQLYAEAFQIMTSDARIPVGKIIGDHYYNFWQDEVHVSGIWRRSPLDKFLASAPEWETVLDIDALKAVEHENWVYKANNCVGGDSDRCLIELSKGGKDESLYREFSLQTLSFVTDGFVVPEAKSYVAWLGENTLLIATDWDDGLTNSGYPLEVRLWKRGTDLFESKSLFKGEIVDTLVAPQVVSNGGTDYPFILRYLADSNKHEFTRIENGNAGMIVDWPLRSDLLGAINGQIIFDIEEDWQKDGASYHIGDILAYDLESGKTELVFSPSEKQAVNKVSLGASSLFVALLDDVVGRVKRIHRTEAGWQQTTIDLPDNGVVKIVFSSSSRDDALVTYESAVQPTALYYVDAQNEAAPVAALPELYDATDVVIRQRFATSTDGQLVPYFLIGHEKVLDKGNAPTILYGYGGFEIAILPVYYENPSRPQHGALAGRMWISRGGVLALGNMRGGGEYGPRWHQSALRENRQLAYDDYFAIAEDLIESGVTAADRLGALGRSNGGLLLGVALTQRPNLFAALDIGVPLLDMLRYNKLLAGASWMGEFGNPDVPEDREFIEKYSPYQNLQEGQEYPKVFFYTSTLDDRVHPGHARKMAAKMADMDQDFYYYENIEGGHGGTANQEQLAMRTALEYAYFVRMLMPTVWDSHQE